MHDTTSLYAAHGRRLSLITPGERDAFLRTALGTLGSLFSALARHYDDEDVICLTRRAVNNLHSAMQPKYVGW
jgi:hypothetical protein